MKAKRWYKEKDANMVKESKVSDLFMAHCSTDTVQGGIWLIDGRCSNHMKGTKELFQDLDEYMKQMVILGDDKEMTVAGKGTIALQASSGKVKLLRNVQYRPNLAHNLLSVGHLLSDGYVVVFEYEHCVIRHRESSILFA